MRMGPKWRWAMLSLVPGLMGSAAGTPIVTASAADCAGLLPDHWRQGVAGADLPAESANVGDWIAFADAQTGRLDQANGRTKDAIAILKRCEEREREAVKRAKRGWWARLTG